MFIPSGENADPTSQFFRRRRDIQGIRAIAVLLVLAYHAKVPGFSGGYIGVDVFFVISGYVITTSILRSELNGHRFSLSQFLLRRVRRLFPAVFVTAIAVPWLHEKAHGLLWWAVLLGFIGVVIMLSPTKGIFEPAAFLSLFSAFTYAVSMIMVRQMGNTETAAMISFYQNIFFFLGACFLAIIFYLIGFQDIHHPSLKFLVRPWLSIPWQDLMWIASCGIIASGGTMTLTAAYHIGPASKVGAFEYSGVLWAPMWGFIFFHEIPAFSTIMGAVLIVIAGLMVLKPSKIPTTHP